MTIVILGVDLGKTSCSVFSVDATGAVVTRRTIRRQTANITVVNSSGRGEKSDFEYQSRRYLST